MGKFKFLTHSVGSAAILGSTSSTLTYGHLSKEIIRISDEHGDTTPILVRDEQGDELDGVNIGWTTVRHGKTHVKNLMPLHTRSRDPILVSQDGEQRAIKSVNYDQDQRMCIITVGGIFKRGKQ